MSEKAGTWALSRLGHSGDEMTGHDFCSLASTPLHEIGWNRDTVKHQLAHVEDSKVRAAYNRAEYLTERLQMMQAWAYHLDFRITLSRKTDPRLVFSLPTIRPCLQQDFCCSHRIRQGVMVV